MRILTALAVSAATLCAADTAQEFAASIRPILVQNCSGCHNPANPKGPANFLKAATIKDMQNDRGLWRSVAVQLRNRTMPPVASKLTEDDRLKVAQWVDTQLRQTACTAGDYAGAGTLRRLNRREYRNTIRDMLGVDFDVTALFPADGTGGAGFDTNGDTLYIQPMMMERYLQAAQQILDRAIVTPKLSKIWTAAELGPSLSLTVPIYQDGDYDVRAALEGSALTGKVALKVDGADAGSLTPLRRGNGIGVVARLDRGTHILTLIPEAAPPKIASVSVEERRADPSAERRAVHYRLLGADPGDQPLQPRKAAQLFLTSFLPKAFRRPVTAAEVDRYLAMYDRGAQRGDPYEERIKLALKAVLVSPDFLFRMEERKTQPGIYPVGQYEMASRLSYFLWSTMPDEQLFHLAEQGRLRDPAVLTAQVERMLDDPRARTFVSTFIGQWLGTQEIGGRFMPILTETLSFYDAGIASDLKMQPVLLFDRIVGENRSLIELLNADYTYLTPRLARFYQLVDSVNQLVDTVNYPRENEFHLVTLPDNRRAGLLGLAGVLGMTSHYQQTSPVLRGAWVLDTLLGTPVPPPPPDVPPLDTDDRSKSKLTTREKVLQHRADPICSACHRLMDPIGFGLENFDWMGRWRDKEKDGSPLDTTGELPSGAKFNGPVELRETLLQQKDEFVRQVTGKVLGYALGRSLQDGDSCTVQRIVDALAKDQYRARTLIREVVLSLPFRNMQGGVVQAAPFEAPKLNISSVISKTQDPGSHNDGEKIKK